MKGLAVLMCLAIAGVTVCATTGTSIPKLSYYLVKNPSAFGIDKPPSLEVLTVWDIVVGVNGVLIAAAVGGPVGVLISLAVAVGLPL